MQPFQPAPAFAPPPPAGPAFDPQLGSVVSEWRAGMGRRFLLAFVTLFFGGGLAAIGIGNDTVAVTIIAVVLTVFFLIWIFVQQAMLRVISYTNGVERIGLFGKKRVLWDQLQAVTLMIVDPAAGAASQGVIVMLIVRALTSKHRKPQSVVLTTRDGKKLTIPGYIKGYDAVLESLVPYLTERLFKDAQYQLSVGQPVSFGKRLVLDPSWNLNYTGLFGKRSLLPLNAVASANIERAFVIIQPRDQKKAWQRIHARNMPNVTVFQRFVALVSPPAAPVPNIGR